MGLVATGGVLGTFGLDGCVKAISCSGDYDHFFALERVYVSFSKHKLVCNKYKDNWFRLEGVKLAFEGIILKLEGVDVLEDAKHFVGAELLVERSKASVLRDGEFHAFDLCLCDVYTLGSKAGKVVNVVDGGAGALLEVVKNDGASCYIPFNGEFVAKVDVAHKTIKLKNEWVME